MDANDTFPETAVAAPAITADAAAEPAVVTTLEKAETAASAPLEDEAVEETLQHKVVRQCKYISVL
jgi:hypothetical protein